jgi:SpoVK/Ycf46/Vps4 family AAA+-type ATPase
MDYNLGDAFNKAFGGKRAQYSVEEIDEAKKRQKKNGGTLMDNLAAVAAERSGKKADGSKSSIEKLDEAISRMSADLDKASGSTLSTSELNATISSLNANIEKDFSTGMGEQTVITDGASALDGFDGLSEVIKEKVYGQDEFIKKLIIAFKRPFVTERDKDDALNSIYITGPSATGKHYTLDILVKELASRKIIKSPSVYSMDLSLYPTSTEEKLFLQDIYSALQSDKAVILFENFEACHISMLTRISDLVTTGSCKLSDRYIMQNGQLVTASNVLAGKTIGEFTASGKYFVFASTKPLDKLAGVMGAPFVNALGDVCETKSLDDEAIAKIADVEKDTLIEKAKKQLDFNLTLDDDFMKYIISQTSKGRALRGVLDTFAETMKALAQLRLERDDLPSKDLTLACESGSPVIVSGDEKIDLSGLLPDSYSGELESIKEEMDAIVGLKEVKEYVYSLQEYYQVQKKRREEGLKAGEVNKHMIFTGNPGTGKTTIARIVSKYLKAIGVLSGGQLVEVSRADLVGRYQGHTAPLVNQVIKSALGGVLFIDEAYSLYRGEEDSFGLEAIDTLVKGIEDNRDDLIVILAGYSNEMEEFLESNSGLKSRFPNLIDFPDYTGEELVEIAKITAKSKGYTIADEALEPLHDFFDEVQATNAREAGNGRLVRNKIEEAILNQSKRLIAEEGADMSLLMSKDFDLNL